MTQILHSNFGRRGLPILYSVFGSKKKESLSEVYLGLSNQKDFRDLGKRLEKHYSGFSNDEQHHIRKYTGEYSATMKDYEQNRATKNSNRVDEHENALHHLQTATEKHKAPEEFHTYTGVRKSPHEGLQNGNNKFTMFSHTSSSLRPNTAHDFASEDKEANEHYKTPGYKHLMKIKVKKGENAGAYIGHHSNAPGEMEFLHTHSKILKVHHEPEIDHENKRVIWHSESA